jgi:hypothetical protein
MTIYLSDDLRNAGIDGFESTIGTSAWIRLYNGTVPTDEGTAIGAQTVLAEFQLPSDWMAASSNGAVAKTGTWSGTAGSGADGSKTADFFRLYTNNSGAPGTCKMQGSCSATGGGGDMTLDDNTPTNGQTIIVNSFTLTAGN